MKLQIISPNKILKRGFLTVEIMIAISLFILFTISTSTLNSSMLGIKTWSIEELNIIKTSANKIIEVIGSSSTSSNLYGNDSLEYYEYPFSVIKSDFINSWGGSSCSPRINFDSAKIDYYANGIFLGAGNKSTDIEVRNSIAYITTDSAIQSQPDLFIINAINPENPTIISSLNTGPGLSALAVAGPYIYLANTSSMSQLQIVDIHDRRFPHVVSQLKLPLPEASTTPPKASSIYYKNGYIYLGTSKWDGAEFYSIDVRDPKNPKVIASFETNTLVNDIFVYNETAYLATSDEAQMRILNVSDKANMQLINSFGPSGWWVQQGKTIEYFEGILALGRTVGGINQINNHEAFVFSTSTTFQVKSSRDIPGGIYGLLIRPPLIFMITHAPLAEFQVWDSTLSKKVFEKSLNVQPQAFSCDWSTLYFATGNENGLSILNIKQNE